MSRQWKPGDVALWDGPGQGLRVFRDGWGARWISETEGEAYPHDGNLRPLVVIDPEDVAAVERLRTVLARWGYEFQVTPGYFNPERDGSCIAAALREFANPTPPKPPEPQGLGAVVEDANGTLWVRDAERLECWFSAPLNAVPRRQSYADTDAVRVLSEGVTP